MSGNEKQIVEQVAGAVTATADMSSTIITALIELQKLTPGEGLLILSRLSQHMHGLAERNSHLESAAHVYRAIGARVDTQVAHFKQDLASRSD